MGVNADIASYYKNRAQEYERIYAKPERQRDLLTSTETLKEVFKEMRVLEIACGTGYWTQRIAETAQAILATDINETVLNIAGTKNYHYAEVTFQIGDVYQLNLSRKYEGLFGGFIWSHIKLQDLPSFIDTIHHYLTPGATVVFMDNNYVEGSSTPIAETDSAGNTYQLRKLDDGTTHSIVKNFPTKDLIARVLAGKVAEMEFTDLKYFWIARYRIL
jgi:demethylmenaquinone methyltransferase/2-methoxy-6-polyprenyl-1,4-benzoquinol methylase